MDDSALGVLLAKHEKGELELDGSRAADASSEYVTSGAPSSSQRGGAASLGLSAAGAPPFDAPTRGRAKPPGPARLPLYAHQVLQGADGHVRLFDVFTMLLLHCQGDLQQRCALLWRMFDMDMNGQLDRDEVLA